MAKKPTFYKIQRQKEIDKHNVRMLMRAFHGCPKNCQECREEEKDWENDK